MQDTSFLPLGHLDGGAVGIRSTIAGQDILIQQSDKGRDLANLLASGEIEFIQQEDISYWRIPHDEEVDRLLVELIDLFISIRYTHPSLVQLELELDETVP
jgi:hypothetical protein